MAALIKAFDPVLGWMARRYQAAVAKELKNYGLRYEDLMDPAMDLDVNEALNRLPPAEVDARNQRLRRAHDISLKKEYLPKEQQALQTPYLNYMKLLNAELAPASLKMLLDTLMSLRAGRDLVHDLGAWPQDALEQVQAENRERILLGTGKPYERTIP